MNEEKVYKKMYLRLNNSVTDVLDIIEAEPDVAKIKLKVAQLCCDTIYINSNPKLRRRKKKARDKCGPFSIIF